MKPAQINLQVSWGETLQPLPFAPAAEEEETLRKDTHWTHSAFELTHE